MRKRYKFEQSEGFEVLSFIQFCLVVVVTLVCGKIIINNALMDAVSEEERLSGHFLIRMVENSDLFYVDPIIKEVIQLSGVDYAFSFFKKSAIKLLPVQLESIPIGLVGGVGSDIDRDGLGDLLEEEIGTSIYRKDTDYDGVSDKEEVLRHYNPRDETKLRVDETLIALAVGRFVFAEGSEDVLWYLNPGDGRRYMVGNPSDINVIAKNLGTEISEDEYGELVK